MSGKLVWTALTMLILAACTTTATSTTNTTQPPEETKSTSPTTTTREATTTSPPEPTSATTTVPPPTVVLSPGAHNAFHLEIHIRFSSEIDDLSSEEFATAAIEILTDPTGWVRAGFNFVHDEESELAVILADGDRVDELCLPLTTHGTVSCQNGPVVAINADRWRSAWDGWSTGVEAYRHYVLTHEVGHLIGLRHPAEKCPSGEPLAAAMTPQTRTTLTCPENGVPLNWEIEWAKQRPTVIGPTPDWDGPRPTWPSGG